MSNSMFFIFSEKCPQGSLHVLIMFSDVPVSLTHQCSDSLNFEVKSPIRHFLAFIQIGSRGKVVVEPMKLQHPNFPAVFDVALQINFSFKKTVIKWTFQRLYLEFCFLSRVTKGVINQYSSKLRIVAHQTTKNLTHMPLRISQQPSIIVAM